MSAAPTVAVLGTGIMGAALARNAARAGLAVRGWSLPLADAERLRDDGITVGATAQEAAAGADIVVTMVPDAAAIESFADEFLGALGPDAVWVQSSTVGVEGADRLIALAGSRGVTIVDAPVLGSAEPAERGELVILASGEQPAIDRCAPYFAAIGRTTLQLGPAGQGSRMKMVTNNWIMSTVAAIAETLAMAEAFGLDKSLFLDAIRGSALDMGYAQSKGAMAVAGEYPAQMRLDHGAKDARLALAAAQALGLEARVTRAAAELLTAGVERGDGALDMAAAYRAALS